MDETVIDTFIDDGVAGGVRFLEGSNVKILYGYYIKCISQPYTNEKTEGGQNVDKAKNKAKSDHIATYTVMNPLTMEKFAGSIISF